MLLGLDRGSTVREPAQRLYYTAARDLVDVYAMNRLRASLERSRRFNEPDTLDTPGETLAAQRAARRVDIENDLEAYLLLTSHADSLRSSEYYRDALKTRLAELAPRSALGDEAQDREEMTALIVRQTDAFVDGLAAGLVEPFPTDRGLVDAAIAVVDVPPTLDGLYGRIRREALARLPPLGLPDAVPSEHLGLFAPAGIVPGFFTRDGWDRVVKRRFQQASANPAAEYWILGRTADDLPSELRDPDGVYDALMTRYQSDYVAAWTRFLHSVRYKDVTGPEAEARLAILGSATDSPIGWLLAVVTEQTTLPAEDTAPRTQGILDRAASAVGLGDDAEEAVAAKNPIAEAFAGIHRLNAPGLPGGRGRRGPVRGARGAVPVRPADRGRGRRPRRRGRPAGRDQGRGRAGDARDGPPDALEPVLLAPRHLAADGRPRGRRRGRGGRGRRRRGRRRGGAGRGARGLRPDRRALPVRPDQLARRGPRRRPRLLRPGRRRVGRPRRSPRWGRLDRPAPGHRPGQGDRSGPVRRRPVVPPPARPPRVLVGRRQARARRRRRRHRDPRDQQRLPTRAARGGPTSGGPARRARS